MSERYLSPNDVNFTTPLPSARYLAMWAKESRILDVGCGYGRTLLYLQEQGYSNRFGVDESPTLIERARQAQVAQPENLYVSDILGFSSPGPMDVVLLMGVIEYFTSLLQRQQLVEQLQGMLSSGGYAYLTTFLRSPAYVIGYLQALRNGYPWGTLNTAQGFPVYHASHSEIIGLFAPYFTVVIDEQTQFQTWSDKKVPGYIGLFQRR